MRRNKLRPPWGVDLRRRERRFPEGRRVRWPRPTRFAREMVYYRPMSRKEQEVKKIWTIGCLMAVAAVGARGAESAEAIRQYREQVGDFSFCVNLTRESVGAVQDAANQYVAGQISQEEWLECLSEAY